MKILYTFKDASAVHLSLDAVMTQFSDTQKIQALFISGKPIVVRRGQRIIVTTDGIWIEDLKEPYQDGEQSA